MRKTTMCWVGGLSMLMACGTGTPRGTNDPSTSDGGSSVAATPPDPFTVRNGASASLLQNAAERRAIFLANQLGSGVFQDAMGRTLAATGIGGTYRDTPQEPFSVRSGSLTGSGAGSVVTPDIPAGIAQGAACAYAEQAPSVPTSARGCRDIVSNAIADAMSRLDREIERTPIEESEVEGAYAPEEVRAWYNTAAVFTVTSSMPYALSALRTAGVCDQAPTQVAASFERGVALGQQLMQNVVRQQQAQTPITECDIRNIVNPARATANNQAPGLSASNPLCDGFSGSAAEMERLASAQSELLSGIRAGIVEQGQVEENRLVREWVCTPPPPPPQLNLGGGGGDGGGGGGGDPLVLDLDGNGVAIESMQAGAVFDFGHGATATEWVYGDALLVLDANGDGAIETSEVFGDVHETADGTRAADGLLALALYDERRRGGNADGRIDANDTIYTRLSLWSDRDGDARVDAGELSPLSTAVRSLDTATGRFVTSDGAERLAADVWFHTAH